MDPALQWSRLGKIGKSLSFVAVLIAGVTFAVGMTSLLNLVPLGLIVSTSPPGASVRIDGEVRGETPQDLKLSRGVHDLTLSLDGFTTEHRLVRLGKNESLFVELRELPARRVDETETPDAPPSPREEARLNELASELQDLKAAFLDDPTQVVSLQLVKSKIDLLERSIAATDSSVERIADTVKWFYATIAAIVMGLLGITVTVFVGKK